MFFFTLTQMPSSVSSHRRFDMEKQEERKPITKEFGGTLSFRGSLGKSKIHSYIQKNIIGIVILIVITLISSFIGSIVQGGLGIVVSLILNIFGIAVGFYSIMKVREIEHYINE
jgi:hypothetical protein